MVKTSRYWKGRRQSHLVPEQRANAILLVNGSGRWLKKMLWKETVVGPVVVSRCSNPPGTGCSLETLVPPTIFCFGFLPGDVPDSTTAHLAVPCCSRILLHHHHHRLQQPPRRPQPSVPIPPWSPRMRPVPGSFLELSVRAVLLSGLVVLFCVVHRQRVGFFDGVGRLCGGRGVLFGRLFVGWKRKVRRGWWGKGEIGRAHV